MLDSHVLDIAEERDAKPVVAGPVARGLLLSGNGSLEGEPSAFRGARTFALLLQHSVQVLRLNFKAEPMGRQPTTAAECCRHLVQLAVASDVKAEHAWGWSFSDVKAPSFEELQRSVNAGEAPPPICLGRWLSGLLRFLALVLRPVWGLPLVARIKGRQYAAQWLAELHRGQGDALGLALDEEAVRRLLAHLRPALRFARQGLAAHATTAAGAGPLPRATASASPTAPSSVAARSRLYAQRAAGSDVLMQVQSILREVLDVAERAEQVLGLVCVLHAQRSAYRVLQSAVMTGPALECLTMRPLGGLIATEEALAPVVQLCTALVAESGLATPAAGVVYDAKGCPEAPSASGAVKVEGGAGASDLCRDLEEQCPAIFAHVDLRYM